ncbi:AzlD domain-containing protein [Falsiphaeobacter marinintestinus]|uniref:AzlD domain-containing protein n=1 Tax=Falsiphaeobacter marinintestinus TaxID=1492905 RepID=UPI0011B46604|nr:AzlD domain-containing protein [Phaeobacter marinintestinus]
MNGDTVQLWIIIVGLAIGSFTLRFVFLGLIGDRPMPDWLLRHLRYTAVAIIPAMVAPATVWPAATGGTPDLARLMAAAVTVVVGYVTKNLFAAIFSGAGTLYGLFYLLG